MLQSSILWKSDAYLSDYTCLAFLEPLPPGHLLSLGPTSELSGPGRSQSDRVDWRGRGPGPQPGNPPLCLIEYGGDLKCVKM